MFRCITNLKAIAVDIDSFPKVKIADWIEINELVPCIFLTAKENNREVLSSAIGEDRIIVLKESYERLFAPNRRIHRMILSKLGIENTELAYLSCSHSFLVNANSFLSGTIWITKSVSYREASNAPDMILNSEDSLKEALEKNIIGFYGERMLFPSATGSATMFPVTFEVEGEEVPMYVLGRYYGYEHYMNQLHPYSTAIYRNKMPEKSYAGAFDSVFEHIYTVAIRNLQKIYNIDYICSVPVKLGKRERNRGIIEGISRSCQIESVSANFTCISGYPDQKGLTKDEREKNIRGVFRYQGDLIGKTVVLIDDISSTGNTLRECVRVLKEKFVEEVVLVVLAINQFGNYWHSDYPQVSCPVCQSKMTLMINGKTHEFFYNCLECFRAKRGSSTMSFADGWIQLCRSENKKVDDMIKRRKTEFEEDESVIIRDVGFDN